MVVMDQALGLKIPCLDLVTMGCSFWAIIGSWPRVGGDEIFSLSENEVFPFDESEEAERGVEEGKMEFAWDKDKGDVEWSWDGDKA